MQEAYFFVQNRPKYCAKILKMIWEIFSDHWPTAVSIWPLTTTCLIISTALKWTVQRVEETWAHHKLAKPEFCSNIFSKWIPKLSKRQCWFLHYSEIPLKSSCFCWEFWIDEFSITLFPPKTNKNSNNTIGFFLLVEFVLPLHFSLYDYDGGNRRKIEQAGNELFQKRIFF